MSCKALKLSGCEVAGSTFQGRKFTFTDRQINQDTFSAKVYNFQNTLITEIQGVKNANDVYFSFDELESQKIGSYKIDYWANLKDVAIEIIAIESFKISSEPCDCASSSDANFTLEIKEESISYSLSISVINVGGSGSGSDGKSAYEIAVENGFVGSESEWLDSLKGADGKDGVDGINGRDGVDGKDGYTPIKGVDYFDGAKGDTGDKGEQGIPGLPGAKGDKGDKGDVGAKGEQGERGQDGYTPIKGVDYFDGKDGLDGAKGDTGDKGDDAQITFATQPEMESQTPPDTENNKAVSLFGLWKWVKKLNYLYLNITTANSIFNKIWYDGFNAWVTNKDGVNKQLAYDENGVNISQGRITTTTSITTETKTSSNLSQNGKNIIIDNGANNINLTVNAFADGNFCATYIKDGTGTITIIAGSGVTLDLVQYTDVVNGKSGSRFMISQNGSTNTFKIFVRNYE